MATVLPSRQRFKQYRDHVRERTRRPREELKQQREPRQRGVRPFRLGRNRERQRGFAELFSRFWDLLGSHHAMLVAVLVVLSVSVGLQLVPLYAPKIVIDHVLGDEPMSWWLAAIVPAGTTNLQMLLALFVATVVFVGLSVSVALWARWQATRISKRLQVESRKQVFDHASRLPLHRVYELKSGGVAGILRDDAGAIGNLVFQMVYNPWRAIMQLLGSLVILLFVDWRLLAVAALVLPMIWFTHRTWISRIRPMWRDVRHTRRGVDAHATEAFGGIRVVRAFGKRRSESSNFIRGNDLMVRQELHTWWWMRAVDTAWQVLIPLATALLLLIGGYQVLQDQAAVEAGRMAEGDKLTVGDLMVFLTYLGALLGPIATLAATATSLQNSLAGLDRVCDLLEEEPEMTPPDDAIWLNPADVDGRVQLQHVRFQYPEAEDPAVDDVSLDVPAGATVAFVGPSGAGKTTLCNLIARFYDPTDGQILLDGTDLTRINVESYRNLLGIVEQDIFLFDGTVAENIAYSRREATMQQIIDAAERANAHEFITEFPDGYDTYIGERGVKLSGGQRQRLAIARALLADPRILILDEATSALDTHSERLIQASLEELTRGRTSFVIAHRLSTIAGADEIVVIDEGRVVEKGTHQALMRRSGMYRDMVKMQLTPAVPETV